MPSQSIDYLNSRRDYNSNPTYIARLALEWWRASGDRTKARLVTLIDHYAYTHCETAHVKEHMESALANIRNWEWQS
jgi:hypothetical protein